MQWFKTAFFLIVGSALLTGCGCRTTCMVIEPAQVKGMREPHVQPMPKRFKKRRGFAKPSRTPDPIPKPEPAPETPVVQEDQKPAPEPAPKGELKRSPIETSAGEFVIPYSEMCLYPEKENSESEKEEKTDWGFITPWLYNE